MQYNLSMCNSNIAPTVLLIVFYQRINPYRNRLRRISSDEYRNSVVDVGPLMVNRLEWLSSMLYT